MFPLTHTKAHASQSVMAPTATAPRHSYRVVAHGSGRRLVALAENSCGTSSMRAFGLRTFSIEVQGVLANDKPAFFRNFGLPALDLGIVELFDAPAVRTNQVIMVLTGTQLKHSLARFKIMALKQARLLELGKDAIHGSQADVQIFGE